MEYIYIYIYIKSKLNIKKTIIDSNNLNDTEIYLSIYLCALSLLNNI